MNSNQKNILFNLCIASIGLVNLVMIIALVKEFVLEQHQEHINWLIYSFATEMVGCLVLGWRKIVAPITKAVKPGTSQRKSPEIEVIKQGDDSFAIEKKQQGIDPNAKNTRLKEEGDAQLRKARNKAYLMELREEYAQQAKNKYDQIPSDSPLFSDAQYQKATADRILGNYSESIAGYEKILLFVSERVSEYSEIELRELKAEPTMMIGNVYIEKGRLDKAISYFLDAWRINPDYMFAVYNLFEVAFISRNGGETRMWAEMLTRFDRYSEISKDVEMKLNLLEDELNSENCAWDKDLEIKNSSKTEKQKPVEKAAAESQKP